MDGVAVAVVSDGVVSEIPLIQSMHPSANICVAFKTTGSVWSYLITGDGLQGRETQCSTGLSLGPGTGLFTRGLSCSLACLCQGSFNGEFNTCACKESFRY